MLTQEAERARELADLGRLIRLWTLPGAGRNLGLWQATDRGAMQGVLQSLPLADWLTTETVPLTAHPNDPVTGEAGGRLRPDRTRRGAPGVVHL
jgi:muconolactone delta-isomerase